jgi:hypothetical protein
MMLSDGCTIYNGNPGDIKQYLSNLNIRMPNYTNPADILIKLAISPKLLKCRMNK